MRDRIKGTNTTGSIWMQITDITDDNSIVADLYLRADEEIPFVRFNTPCYVSRSVAEQAIEVIEAGFAERGVLPTFSECGEIAPQPNICRATAYDKAGNLVTSV
jgi:hypothetical protein